MLSTFSSYILLKISVYVCSVPNIGKRGRNKRRIKLGGKNVGKSIREISLHYDFGYPLLQSGSAILLHQSNGNLTIDSNSTSTEDCRAYGIVRGTVPDNGSGSFGSIVEY